MSVPKAKGLSKLKKKHFRVKHQKVKLFRASEPLLSVFMWGVNHTINELSHVTIPVMLLPDDFRAYSKIKVDNHLFNKENMPSHFKVKEYCPLVFRNLRERFGIDDLDFKESLTRSQPLPDDSSGKSGAKFYMSYDRLFIIKTLTSEEVERMHSFLKHYHPYIVEVHGRSLLPQYLGMYRLTVDSVEHYLVVMRSVFSNHLPIHTKFDLKGSTVDREASEKELEKELPTLKDNDFVKQQMKIYIGDEAKDKLLETLQADVDFLTTLHLMDYSLLLGIHECDRASQNQGDNVDDSQLPCEESAESAAGEDMSEADESETELRGASSNTGWGFNSPPDSPRTNFAQLMRDYDGYIIPQLDIYAIPSSESAPVREIYFIAIIDVLTQYGVKKQAAKAAKAVKYGSSVDGISTCEPEQYAKRFTDFMQRHIEYLISVWVLSMLMIEAERVLRRARRSFERLRLRMRTALRSVQLRAQYKAVRILRRSRSNERRARLNMTLNSKCMIYDDIQNVFSAYVSDGHLNKQLNATSTVLNNVM